MVTIGCESDPRFEASTIDAPAADGRANYTVDTLERLANESPESEIFNLVGADSFVDLARWREPHRLLELAQWIVVNRPGSTLQYPAGMTLTLAEKRNVLPVEDVHEDVSATELRRKLEAGERCEGLLPSRVMDYIQLHGLYR